MIIHKVYKSSKEIVFNYTPQCTKTISPSNFLSFRICSSKVFNSYLKNSYFFFAIFAVISGSNPNLSSSKFIDLIKSDLNAL